MFLQRISKAQTELAPGQRSLGLRERSLLLLAEGMPVSKLHAMYHGEGAALVQRLVQEGYLQPLAPCPPAGHPTATNTPSLAGVRMYLFDLCERLFANRMHETAAHLRHLLREARDVDSMLAARDQLLHAVHTHAGAERAEAIRQQLSSMLHERSLETVA